MSTTSNGNKKQLSLHTSNENRLNALKAVDSRKPHSQKDRQNEKAEYYVPDEGTR